MTCDLKMSLAVAAEKSIRPLAEKVSKLARHLTEIQKRAADETENLTKARDDVARWKTLAGDYLGDSPGAFDKYKTSLKRALARLETVQEAVKIFASDLIPHATQELVAAREKLAQAFTATCAEARADCEASMAEKLGAIVAEHDAFMAAIAELGRTFGTSSRGEPPKIAHVRLAEIKRTMTGRRWLTFTRAPAAPAPAASATMPAAAVSACPASVESTRTPEVGESVTSDAPLPPEAPAAALGVAAECPAGAVVCRARVLRRSTGDAGDVAPTPLDADTLDPYPLPPALDDLGADALDGADEPDAEAEAEAGEEADEAEAEAPPADG